MDCIWCAEEIGDPKTAKKLPRVDFSQKVWNGREDFYHMECLVRATIGSVAHQERRCSCYGGTGEDDESLTKRQAALQAYVQVIREGLSVQ
jgi:hypothetical protein